MNGKEKNMLYAAVIPARSDASERAEAGIQEILMPQADPPSG